MSFGNDMQYILGNPQFVYTYEASFDRYVFFIGTYCL